MCELLLTFRLAVMRSAILVLALALLLSVPSSGALAQAASVLRTEPERAALNASAVGLVTGAPGGTYNRMGMDLATVIGDASRKAPFRVVVMNSLGSVQNLDDLVNLRGVDVAMVQSDVLQLYSAGPDAKVLENKLRMIASLHREEIHILARKGVNDIAQLAGRRVNIGPPGSGTQITARNFFARLGIAPIEDATPTPQAVSKLIAGQIDAMVYVVGKPAALFKSIEGGDIQDAVLQFLPVPQAQGLQQYVPTELTADDYPSLIASDKPVTTLAVPSIMAVFAFDRRDNPTRYAALEQFVYRFFDHAGELVKTKGQYSPSWCQANLGADVPGWQRFDAATRWFDAHKDRTIRLCALGSACAPCADTAAARPLSPCEQRAQADLARQNIGITDFTQPYAKLLFSEWMKTHPNAC